MRKVFSNADAASFLERTLPSLYASLRDAVVAGGDKETILAAIRRPVAAAKSPGNPQAGELTYRTAAMTVDYLFEMTAQIQEIAAQSLRSGDLGGAGFGAGNEAGNG